MCFWTNLQSLQKYEVYKYGTVTLIALLHQHLSAPENNCDISAGYELHTQLV